MRQKMKGILAFVRDNISSHQIAVLVLLYDKEKAPFMILAQIGGRPAQQPVSSSKSWSKTTL